MMSCTVDGVGIGCNEVPVSDCGDFDCSVDGCNGFLSNSGCYSTTYFAPPGGGGGGGGGGASAPPDCGQALTATGILPTSATGIALSSTLLGENSWSLIGTQQYQNGDTLRNPTGPTITTSTVAQEDSLMLDVIANLASAHGLTQLAQVQAPGVFLGYVPGTADFASYQLAAVGSSKCNDLTQVSQADDSFAAGGSVARTGYNQFRGVVQRSPTTHRTIIRNQGPGVVRVGGTDFFTVANP
jgi:hypothetical protein